MKSAINRVIQRSGEKNEMRSGSESGGMKIIGNGAWHQRYSVVVRCCVLAQQRRLTCTFAGVSENHREEGGVSAAKIIGSISEIENNGIFKISKTKRRIK